MLQGYATRDEVGAGYSAIPGPSPSVVIDCEEVDAPGGARRHAASTSSDRPNPLADGQPVGEYLKREVRTELCPPSSDPWDCA
jgi:hypothetical protein